MTESHPRPDGLEGRGGRFWDAVTSKYALRADELIILEDACYEINLVDRLQGEIEFAKMVVTGGYEQEVANPLITEIRQHRGMVARLVGVLKLPDEPAADKSSASESARKAANARWSNGAS